MNALIQPGRILAGRYRIDQQIGVGGMAVVYRATDLNTQHFVAVKVLKPEYNQDAEYVARFQREAEAASKMTHHNIVNLLDVGMDSSGNRYLIMEYVEGQTLKDVIREKGRLSETSAVQITIVFSLRCSTHIPTASSTVTLSRRISSCSPTGM